MSGGHIRARGNLISLLVFGSSGLQVLRPVPQRYHTIGQFLKAAEAWINFYNERRPHESLKNLSPNSLLSQTACQLSHI